MSQMRETLTEGVDPSVNSSVTRSKGSSKHSTALKKTENEQVSNFTHLLCVAHV